MANQRKQFLELARAVWIIWLIWVLVMAVATAVAMAVSTAVAAATATVVFGAVFGAITGTAQWLFLRKLVYRSGWWVLASAVGWSIAWMGSWPWAVSGAIIGTAQWLVLQKRVRQFGWWVLATSVRWSIALPVEEAWARVVAGVQAWIGVRFLFVDWPGTGAGAVSGAITGLALILLLRHLTPEAQGPQQEESVDPSRTDRLSDSAEGIE